MKKMKAQQLNSMFNVSEIQVSYSPSIKLSDRPIVSNSKQAFDLLYANWNLNTIDLTESFVIMLLNRMNKVIGIVEIATGGVGGVVIDPKLIFSIALKCVASNIILAHNHPSTNLKPSSDDIYATRRLIEGGKLLDINIFDHIILTRDGYYSFKEDRML